MYAHQAIEDLLRFKDYYGHVSNKFQDNINIFIEAVQNSQKFHFGNLEELIRLSGFDKLIEKDIYIKDFIVDNWQEIKLPYQMNWFDFNLSIPFDIKDKFLKFKKDNLTSYVLTDKIGIFSGIRKENNETFVIIGVSFHKFKSNWVFMPTVFTLFLEKKEIGFKVLMDESDVNINTGSYDEKVARYNQFLEKVTCYLILALKLLNCKNIVTEKQFPSASLNKKRIKRNKIPIFSYHTLKVNPLKTKQRKFYHDFNQKKMRLHLQRGHWKEFNGEKLLFGKFEGRYWWQPHVRGQNKKGIILKDYDIVVNN